MTSATPIEPVPSVPDHDRAARSVAGTRTVLFWPRWFVVVGAVLGLVGVFTTPIDHTPDEAAHFRRVSTLAHGALVAPGLNQVSGRYVVDGCVEALLARSNRAYVAFAQGSPVPSTDAHGWQSHFSNPPCLADRSLRGGTVISNTEVYSPLPYLPALVGYVIGKPIGGALGALYGARLIQLIAYLALCWGALRMIPWGKPLIALVALLPTGVGNAAGVGVDPIAMALSFVMLAWILARIDAAERAPDQRAPRRVLVGMVALIAAVSLTKTAIIPLTLMSVALPVGMFGSRRGKARWLGLGAGAIAITGGLFQLLVTLSVHIRTAPGVDSKVTGSWLTTHPFAAPMAFVHALTYPPAARFIFGSISTSVGLDVSNPPVLMTLIGIGLIIAARLVDPSPRFAQRPRMTRAIAATAQAVRRHCQFERLLAVIVALIGLGVIVFGIYQTSNPPGTTTIRGIQGRYFLPFVPLVLFGVRPTRVALSLAVQRVILVSVVAFNVTWMIIVLRWWQLL